MQFRIGDRDPQTGLYIVLHPDGGESLNGIKNFNGAHQAGDPVLATQRSDGMLILHSNAAVEIADPLIFRRTGDSQGYNQGQIWNTEESAPVKHLIVRYRAIFDELETDFYTLPEGGSFVRPLIVSGSQRSIPYGGYFGGFSGSDNARSFGPNQAIVYSYPYPGTYYAGGGYYELQLNLDLWEGSSIEIHLVPVNFPNYSVDSGDSLYGTGYGLQSNTFDRIVSRCEMEWEIARSQKSIPYEDEEILLSDPLIRAYDDFNSEILPSMANSNIDYTFDGHPYKTAFIINCNRRSGRVSVS
jgi:hypothetical protein